MKKAVLSFVALTSVFPVVVLSDTLSQAVQYAVSNMPDIAINVAHRNAFAQTIDQAKAGYFPSVDLNAGYGVEYAENPVATAVDQVTNNTLARRELGVRLTENIFDGFNTVNEIKRTKNETLAAEYDIAGASNDLGLNVAEQYLNVLQQQKLVQLAQQNLSAHYSIANMILQRKEAGVSRAAEVTQSKSRIALAQSNLITEQSNLQDAQTKYERFVKQKPKNLVMPRIPQYPYVPNSLAQALQIAYVNHPILKSANADVQAAIAQHKSSQFNNYPKVDIVLESDYDKNIDGIEGPQNNDLAMLRANYNIFKGGADIAKQRETAFQIMEAQEIRDRTILQIKESINLAWTAMVNQARRVDKLDQYRQNAQKTLSAYREEYRLDKRTLLDLLDSQNEFFQANVDYQKAYYNEIFARYRLLNAMGTLYKFLHVSFPDHVQQLLNNDSSSPFAEPPYRDNNNNSTGAITANNQQNSPLPTATTKSVKFASIPQTSSNFSTTMAAKPYAIQVFASQSKQSAMNFLKQNTGQSLSIVEVNGLYKVMDGRYATRAQAGASLAGLPAQMKAYDPWIAKMADNKK